MVSRSSGQALRSVRQSLLLPHSRRRAARGASTVHRSSATRSHSARAPVSQHVHSSRYSMRGCVLRLAAQCKARPLTTQPGRLSTQALRAEPVQRPRQPRRSSPIAIVSRLPDTPPILVAQRWTCDLQIASV
ncbi:hypothetical protein FA09DRAFT_132375 [Tilletiopsis washingtonensis]|uniref:Uncharacterized protein n=1 Tax=Tilletiopsis washingtonensis TaxID=58919 RepID=A0A316Z201_9BASI|nr:hypothetical protein FA09DRAFT_132375 [Tilletiopsis washingtonensis]PWN95561.1 hypothetical protein FA09DRAFT_132375 [Tilletiopsis washingtonensis]